MNELGKILPNVYVRKISLTNQGFPVISSNPHIKSDIEGKDLSLTDNNDNLKVEIDFFIKEEIDDNSDIGNWLSNINIEKYLYITIAQSTNIETTGLIELDTSILKSSSILDGLIKKNIPLSDKFKTLGDYKFTVSETGSRVYEIDYNISFNIAKSSIKHLTYFFYASLNIIGPGSLSEDNGINLNINSLSDIHGRVISERVLESGQILDELFLFITPSGETWAGHINYTGNQFYTGDIKTIESLLLTKKTISNYKVQDFRILKDIERVEIDFSFIENNIFKKVNSFDITKNMSMTRNYLTDFLISGEKNKKPSIFFGIDIESILDNESIIRGIFSNKNKDRLSMTIDLSSIKSILVKRRRVKDFRVKNTLGSWIQGREPFEDSDSDEIVIFSSDLDGKLVNKKTSIGYIEEIEITHENSSGMRYFSIEDLDMLTVTDGKYQYGIELEIIDGNIIWLNDRIEDIREFIGELSEWVTASNTPNNFNNINGNFTEDYRNRNFSVYTDPLEAPWNIALILLLEVLNNFYSTEKNIDKIVSSFNLLLNPRSSSPSSLLIGLGILEKLLSQLEYVSTRSGINSSFKNNYDNKSGFIRSSTGRKNTIKIKEMSKELFDSNKGTIEAPVASILLNEIELNKSSRESGITRILGRTFLKRSEDETNKYFNVNNDNIVVSGPASRYLKDISLRKTSLAYFTPSFISVGSNRINLLDDSVSKNDPSKFNSLFNAIKAPSKNNSLKEVMATQYSSVLIEKNSKKQNSLRDKDSRDLFPRSTGKTKILRVETHKPFLSTDEYQDIKNKIAIKEIDTGNFKNIFSTRLFNLNYEDNTFDRYDRKIVEIEAVSNLNISSISNPKSNSILTGDIPDKNSINYSNVNQKNVRVKDSGFLTSNRRITGVDKLSNAPNQIKALAIGSILPSAVRLDWHNNSENAAKLANGFLPFFFNYKFLIKVEVMIGYDTSVKDYRQIKSPIWVKATNDIYDNNIGNSLLCRLKRYEDPDLEIIIEDSLELDLYDKYFILIPEEVSKIPDISPSIDSLPVRSNFPKINLPRPSNVSRGQDVVREITRPQGVISPSLNLRNGLIEDE